jgi:hypothetical protein
VVAVSLSTFGVGVATTALGVTVVVVCRAARSGAYVTKRTEVVMRRRGSEGDRERIARIIRASLAAGMAFGGLVAVLGIASAVIGLR